MTSRIIQGDALAVLRTLPAESVHCCVSSPPYYGLRAYGTNPQVWGGEPGCDHEWQDATYQRRSNDQGKTAKQLSNRGANGRDVPVNNAFCAKCGAWRGELGLEPTPELYVEHLVAVFREVRRVLHPSGTCWVNLGDSYWGGKGRSGYELPHEAEARRGLGQTMQHSHNVPGYMDMRPSDGKHPTIKPKDLCMIPARFALAMQADGWWLRSDIIWAKGVSFCPTYSGSSMPESVQDRPSRSHEYLFLLTKSPRYYYDHIAVREALRWPNARGIPFVGVKYPGNNGNATYSGNKYDASEVGGRNLRSVWTINPAGWKEAHFATFPEKLVEPCVLAGTSAHGVCSRCLAPYERVVERESETHPPQPQDHLPENGRRENGTRGNRLANVGQYMGKSMTLGWRPTCTCGHAGLAGLTGDDLEIIATPTGERVGPDPSLVTGRAGFNRPRGPEEGQRPITRYEQRCYAEQLRNSPHREQMETEAGSAFAHYIRIDKSGARPVPPDLLETWLGRGWLERVNVPDVQPVGVRPSVVLDPFCGSGTVGVVAKRLGRDFVGVELNPDYVAMAERRIEREQPPLLVVEP